MMRIVETDIHEDEVSQHTESDSEVRTLEDPGISKSRKEVLYSVSEEEVKELTESISYEYM